MTKTARMLERYIEKKQQKNVMFKIIEMKIV